MAITIPIKGPIAPIPRSLTNSDLSISIASTASSIALLSAGVNPSSLALFSNHSNLSLNDISREEGPSDKNILAMGTIPSLVIIPFSQAYREIVRTDHGTSVSSLSIPSAISFRVLSSNAEAIDLAEKLGVPNWLPSAAATRMSSNSPPIIASI